MEWVTLTGRLTRGSNQPATGYVHVRVLETLQDPESDQVLVVQPQQIQADPAGEFSTLVPVTEDPARPVWVVVDLLPVGAAPDQLVFQVDGSQDPVDLADVTAVPVVPDSDAHEVAIPWSVIGQPGGVAGLDAAGKILAQFLPASAGGMVGWWEGDGPPPVAIPGAAPGDMYYDRIGNHFYQLQ
ncbi:MAG TPA: hypothetical protein VGW74_20220 [Propionibacteriaceae bacterium]|nr:hypothetical protein [Propionibacteriaceae bacterium]